MNRIAVVVIVLLVAAGSASARVTSSFPRVRSGVGSEPTAGGGVIAGQPFVARGAVIAWSRRWNDLNLYLLPRKKVTCRNLRLATTKPKYVVEVYVTNQPRVFVNRPMPNAQVTFMTILKKPPAKIAGLKHGAVLTFTRVDSYPGGVWHGTFRVPTQIYGNGKLYGYNGTFAAKWCELRR